MGVLGDGLAKPVTPMLPVVLNCQQFIGVGISTLVKYPTNRFIAIGRACFRSVIYPHQGFQSTACCSPFGALPKSAAQIAISIELKNWIGSAVDADRSLLAFPDQHPSDRLVEREQSATRVRHRFLEQIFAVGFLSGHRANPSTLTIVQEFLFLAVLPVR